VAGPDVLLQFKDMSASSRARTLAILLAGALGLGVAWALWQSVHRPGYDFATYHDAWRRVLVGEGATLYRDVPGYLYAPVFAVLFAPLGLLPWGAALAIWHAAKLALLLAAGRALVRSAIARGLATPVAWSITLGATVFGMRPLLYELRLGQLNALLVGAAIVLWLGRDVARPSAAIAARWAGFTLLAAGKLILLPLVALPWIRTASSVGTRRAERLGVAAGLALTALLPLIAVGPKNWAGWHREWLARVAEKGVATELGNSSAAATLARLLGGAPARAVYAPGVEFDFAWVALPAPAVRALGLALQLTTLLAFLALARLHPRREEAGFLAVALALVHLATPTAYRYYFVTLIPLAFAWLLGAASNERRRRRAILLAAGGASLIALNPGWLGVSLAARLDAFSPWLWVQVALAAGVLRDGRSR
jgi:hypothetical protein